jgi:predicted anti-sigma-YlaC factor YlaD
MRCEEVRQELALDSSAASLTAEVKDHLANCPHCRRAQVLLSSVDESLRRNFVWEPPRDFVNRVVSHAAPTAPRLAPSPGVLTWNILQGAVIGVLLLVAMYVGLHLFVWAGLPLLAAMARNVGPVAWGCAAFSLLMSAWLTRRALR